MKCTFLLVLILFAFQGLTQDKRDYLWLFGSDQQIGDDIRALKFDFRDKPFSPQLRDKGLSFDRNNVSICDKEGNLLFYSNGCAIANSEHEVMVNGDSLNIGDFLNEIWLAPDCLRQGYPGRQDMLILEDPAKDYCYYVIHKRLDKDDNNDFHVRNLSYSYVDLNVNNGLGEVVIKNKDFHSLDNFLWSYLTAIYKDNGRDWWIVNPGDDGNFYFYSIDESNLELSHIQESGISFDQRNSSAGGDAKFSPDGSMYAYFSHTDGLLLYSFDRNSGELSDLKMLSIYKSDNLSFTTCEWSPNSEFLYLATGDSLWQVEVAYEDLNDGKIFIAEHNGVRDPFSTRFFLSTLGPDCKIYIRPGSSSYSFHVIHKPNEKGIACDLVQQGIKLPEVSSTGSFPNYPRFRVDAAEKCDPSINSIFGEYVYWRRDLDIYPNPVHDILTVKLPESMAGILYIFDNAGAVLWRSEKLINTEELIIDVSYYSQGHYSIEYIPIDPNDKNIRTNRFIKMD